MLHGTIQGQVTYLWGPEVKRSSYRNLTASAIVLSTFLHEGYFPSCALFLQLIKSMYPGGSVAKNPPANAGDSGDVGSIPGLGRSPGGRNGNPLQYSCLENP